jgi:Tfp pilus assembly protein PilN
MAKKIGWKLEAEIKRQIPAVSARSGYTLDQLRRAVWAVAASTVAETIPESIQIEAAAMIEVAVEMLSTVEVPSFR